MKVLSLTKEPVDAEMRNKVFSTNSAFEPHYQFRRPVNEGTVDFGSRNLATQFLRSRRVAGIPIIQLELVGMLHWCVARPR